MTDFTWPSSIVPAASPLTWLDNTVVFLSPLSGTTRTESRPGGRWAISIAPPAAKNSQTQSAFEAFLLKLNGAEHRAVIKDFGYQRSGPGGGNPLIDGAAQTGLTLETTGWTNSTTVLYAGDRIGVSDQMIPVVSDVTSDGAGDATITLAHPIRTAPNDFEPIEIDNPTARYILMSRVTFEPSPGGIKKIAAVNFEEAIP